MIRWMDLGYALDFYCFSSDYYHLPRFPIHVFSLRLFTKHILEALPIYFHQVDDSLRQQSLKSLSIPRPFSLRFCPTTISSQKDLASLRVQLASDLVARRYPLIVGLNHLTVRQLRSRCNERGLCANGTKGQLRKRLKDDQRASFCTASLPDPDPPTSSPPIPSIEKVCKQRGLLELDIDKNPLIQRALSLEECSTQGRAISCTLSVVPTRPRGIHKAWFGRIQPSKPLLEECSEPEGTFSSIRSHPDPTDLAFSLLRDRQTLASLSNGDLGAIANHCLHPPTPVGHSEQLMNDQHEKGSIDARTRRKERDAAGDLDAFEMYKQEVAAIKKSLRRELDVFEAEKRVFFFWRGWGSCRLLAKSWRYVSVCLSISALVPQAVSRELDPSENIANKEGHWVARNALTRRQERSKG